MDKKIILRFLIISIIITIFISLITVYNINNNNKKQALNNAEMISNVVKNGLTSFMKNDDMQNIDHFLNSVSNMEEINKLWIVRSDLVNKQFPTLNPKHPKDDIDKEVLSTGETKYTFNSNSMRISIPYKASWDNNVNCTSCHNVTNDDILGAVTIEMDLSKVNDVYRDSFYLIPLLVFISALIIMLSFRKILNQYLSLFSNITESLNSTINGRFKKISYPENLSADMINTMDNFNNLLTTFKDTSKDIDKKLKVFIGNSSLKKNASPFEESKRIVTNLSNLYQYKKEIELDNSKDEIYTRLSQILVNQFNLKSFTFTEINLTKQKMEITKKVGDSFYCQADLEPSPHLCRAARTKNDVISVKFHDTCPYFKQENKYHYCISTSVSENVYLIINFVLDSVEELQRLKENISFIKSYINESAPSIEVKILMNALKESAFRDVLTGLYNRKFLEEHTKKLIPQSQRDKFEIAVLLLDMDHFKAVNDEYGHHIGDRVLKELARILLESVRESDIVVRYGGEEFMVLLVNIKSIENATAIADKIRTRVSQNDIDVYAGAKLRKTVSIGLSMFPSHSTNFEAVVKNADIALYEAKNKGRNQVVVFSEDQVSSVDLF